MCSATQKSLSWCRLWFYDCLQTLKFFLCFFQEQMAIWSFLGIYNSFVQFRSSLHEISMISSVFCRFSFRMNTFSCGTVLPLLKVSSTSRSDELYVNSYVTVTACFMDQTSTIHSVDIGFINAVYKLSSSKQCKIQCFNPLLRYRLMVSSMKTNSCIAKYFRNTLS